VDQANADADDEDERKETVEKEGTPITPSFTNQLRVKIAYEVPQVDLVCTLTHSYHHPLT
jgi:hypothetical protein